MEATIVIKGNQVEQYKVTLYLPAAWCRKFSGHNQIRVYGETLSGLWAYDSGADGMRSACGTCSTLEQAHAKVEALRSEIANAKKFLTSVVDTENIYIVDLGGDDD